MPHLTTIQKAYERLKGVVWTTLLRLTACSEGFASIDASGFQRRLRLASLRQTGEDDDTNTVTRKHDSRIALPLVKRLSVRTLVGDKGYDSAELRSALRAQGVRPVIPHREFSLVSGTTSSRTFWFAAWCGIWRGRWFIGQDFYRAIFFYFIRIIDVPKPNNDSWNNESHNSYSRAYQNAYPSSHMAFIDLPSSRNYETD